MKPLIILVITLAALSLGASASWAQVASPPASGENNLSAVTQYLPGDFWEYRALDDLQTAGIVVVARTGRGLVSRREIAMGLARFAPLIDPTNGNASGLSQSEQELVRRLGINPKAIGALLSLVTEFAPEINQLGQDPDSLKWRLDWLLMSNHDPAVVPVDDPIYAEVDTVEKGGLPLRDLWGGNGRWIWPRSQFALAIIHQLPYINANSSSRTKMSPIQREILDNLAASAPAIKALRSLTVEFAPEISQMNQDPVAIEKRLDELLAASPFPDVPKDHWASQSVQTLRKTGIVDGYPDGSY